MSRIVLHGRRENDAGCPERDEPRDDLREQGRRDPATPRAGFDEDVVQRAVRVEERVPIPRFEPRVGVADPMPALFGYEQHDGLLRELTTKEPRVAVLDAIDEQKSERVERMVIANELPRHARDIVDVSRHDGANSRFFRHGRVLRTAFTARTAVDDKAPRNETRGSTQAISGARVRAVDDPPAPAKKPLTPSKARWLRAGMAIGAVMVAAPFLTAAISVRAASRGIPGGLRGATHVPEMQGKVDRAYESVVLMAFLAPPGVLLFVMSGLTLVGDRRGGSHRAETGETQDSDRAHDSPRRGRF